MDKVCSKCGETKPLEEFPKDKGIKSGLRADCKLCNRAKARAWREANVERANANTKAWREANVERVRESGRTRYYANLESYRAVNKAWREANVERVKAKNTAWREANVERVREHSRRWKRSNPEYLRFSNANRKAAQRNATPSWADLKAIRKVYTTCPPGHHVDHIVPLKGEFVCGLHVHYNLQHLPASENISKKNKLVEAYL